MLYHSNSFREKSRTALYWLLSGCVAMFMQCAAFASQSVTLTWDPNTDTNVVGYKIYFGGTSQVYTNSISVGNVTNTTITGLLDGTTYFFAATTYDASGVESDFSNEASYNTGGTNLVSTSPVSTNTIPVVIPNLPPTSNLPPTLNSLGNLTINENNGSQVVNLLGVGLGSGSQLIVTAVSSNPALIPNPTVNYTSPNTTGTLIFAPANNGNGTAKITVTANNGQSESNVITRSFTITVKAVNQPPTLNPIGNLVIIINENFASQTVSLTGITSGASNEKQTLQVTASSSNKSLIPNPTVNYVSPKSTGKLTFKPMHNATGTATITVTVNDGGKSNNIVKQTFTITVINPAATIKPKILNSLTNCVAVVGQNANLCVNAAGTGPLNYQWHFNGTSLAGATSPMLTLNNISTNQAGTYYATVSNIAGLTNSTVAALIVYPTAAATLTSMASASSDQFTLNVTGVPGYQYIVQASSDLVNWTSVQTNTAPFTFVDNGVGQVSHRFYRAAYIAP